MCERPGALAAMLAPTAAAAMPSLPDLALGLPSEVALRRPDIRAAEARLHSATAKIGVAKADLYPSIRLGCGFKDRKIVVVGNEFAVRVVLGVRRYIKKKTLQTI